MDFSSFPDNVFLKIFRYLPFKERVRSGRVNSSFRRMSTIVISETKLLDINEEIFNDRFTPETIVALVELCARNLAEIRFRSRHEHEIPLLKAFDGYDSRCPNLKTVRCGSGSKETMELLLQIFPRLQALIVDDPIFTQFPTNNETLHCLQTLQCVCNGFVLCSLIDRVQNLKHFTVKTVNFCEPADALDQFLAATPRLETFRLTITYGQFLNLAEQRWGNNWRLDSLWRLKRLTVLKIGDEFRKYPYDSGSSIGDYALTRAAESFPRLRVLSAPVFLMSNRGLTALASSLADLRELRLECRFLLRANLSAGVHALSTGCPNLRKLRFVDFGCVLSPDVFVELFHNCPQLSYVDIWEFVPPINSPARAESLITTLAAGCNGKRKIHITIHTNRTRTRRIWRSKIVIDALEKLKLDDDGVEVKFRWPNMAPTGPARYKDDEWESTDEDDERTEKSLF